MAITMTATDCLADLYDRTDYHDRLASLIFGFMSDSTVERTVLAWLRNERTPMGMNLVRISHFLGLLGYKVAEIEGMDPAVRSLSEGVGFGILSRPLLEEKLDFFDWDHILRLVRGGSSTIQARCEDIARIVQPYKAELERVKAEWQARVKAVLQVLMDSISGATDDKAVGDETSGGVMGVSELDEDDVIVALAHMLQATLTLAKKVASNDFTAEQRALLRELAGKRTPFDLKNTLRKLDEELVKLCGERARNELS